MPVVLAGSLTTLARILILADRPNEAKSVAERALRLYIEEHGTLDHPHNADALTALGMAERRLGAHPEAAQRLRAARRIYEKVGHHRLPEVLGELALLPNG